MKYLIAGLGNIGVEYDNTRHNIGFMVMDELAKAFDSKWELGKQAFYTSFKHKGRIFILIKPTTYMNLSGKSVNYWMQQHKIPKENILVIVDDIALPYGKMRLRSKGSSAGHNGLKDIEAMTGGQNYARLKFGIGDDYQKGRQIDYVLGNFNKEEMKTMPELLDRASQFILSFTTIGPSRTMSTIKSKVGAIIK